MWRDRQLSAWQIMNELCAFERALLVPSAHLNWRAIGFDPIPWDDYLLNPRRLRGSDFLMRWSQGVWSEHRITEAINRSRHFWAIPYGPSGVAPDGDPRQFELYFERLERAGMANIKRPDLLVVRAQDQTRAEAQVARAGGASELPFQPEEDLRGILDLAVAAIECENSLWKAERMPAFGRPLRLQKRTGRMGAAKAAVMPTVILKEEDRGPLNEWESAQRVPIHIWQAFFDRAYGIALSEANRLIADGAIEPTRQIFQAPGGATTAKIIYKLYYHYAYNVGAGSSEPQLLADCIEDRNGHILPYVRFEGGVLQLDPEALQQLQQLAER